MANNEIPKKEDILAGDGADQEDDWHSDAQDIIDGIKAQVEMNDLLDVGEDDDWAIRARDKATYARVALKRVERRLIELGDDLPPYAQQSTEVKALKGCIARLRGLLNKHGIDSSHITY